MTLTEATLVDDRGETGGTKSRDLLLSFTQVTTEGGFLTSQLVLETTYVGPSAGTGSEVQEVVERHARERGRVQASCYARRMAKWFKEAAKAQEAQLHQQELRWDDLDDSAGSEEGPGSRPPGQSTP